MSSNYIFLSYSHKDISKIQNIIDWLEENYHVWYDKNLGVAREYNEEIADQIRNAQIVIAFFSSSYMESPYCRDEIMYARTKGVEILGIILDETQMPEGMQLRLGRFQMMNFKENIEYDKIISNIHVQTCKKNGNSENLLDNLQHSNREMKRKQLPRMLFTSDLAGKNKFSTVGKWEKSNSGTLRVPIGIRQDMETDEISEAYYDTDYGHQYICGTTMSGKSTILQTILFQLMEYYDPDTIQFYLIDFGNYMLDLFVPGPHVGDIMHNNEVEKIKRFFIFIEKELKERIRFFRNGSYTTYAQKYGIDKPIILIVIDGFESFWDEFLIYEENQNTFKMLLREGMRAGILFLLGKGTAKRITYGLSMENVRTLAALGYEKADQYDDAFDGYFGFSDSLRKRIQQENFELPGKGLLKAGKKMYFVQSALPIDVAEDYDRYEALGKKCKEMSLEWDGDCAHSVPTIPENFTSDFLFQLTEVNRMHEGGKHLSIGLDLYSAGPVFLSLADNFIYPIAGNVSSGKSNLIRLFMKEAAFKNWKGIVIDSKKIHKAAAEEMNFLHVSKVPEMFFACQALSQEIKVRKERKSELESMLSGKTGELILDDFEPYFIFIDGLDEFYELLCQEYSEEKNIAKFMFNIMEKGTNCGVYFFITVDSNKRNTDYQEPVAGMTKMIKSNCHQGIFLGGDIMDDCWFNLNYQNLKGLNYNLEMKHGKGTGVLVKKNTVTKEDLVRVPLV